MTEAALRLLAFAMIVVSGACSSTGTTDRTEVVDLGDLPGVTSATDWTLVVVDGETGQTIIHNQDRAASRFPPASTFKIPNALIALELEVAPSREFAIDLDPAVVDTSGFFPPSWHGKQTLESAFRNSVVWYFQEIARRIGPDRMQSKLDDWGYGNREIGPQIDSFWLQGPLAISPLEQVAFLRDLHQGTLRVSPDTVGDLREMMLLGGLDDTRFYGKTGTSKVTPTRENGWIVGFVERGGDTLYYALNMEGETVWEDWPPQRRLELIQSLLERLGLPR